MRHVLVALLFLMVASAYAAPSSMNYQGYLTNASNDPVVDGTYDLIFKIYNVSSGGTELWVDTLSVTTYNGLFSVQLGEDKSIDHSLFQTDDLWLSITVLGDSEIIPRTKFATVPFAFKSTYSDTAAYAQTLNGVSDSDWLMQDNYVYNLDDSVGIGVSIPLAKLHVNGQLKANTILSESMTSNGITHPFHKFTSSSSDYRWEASPDGHFYLYDQNNLAYRFFVRSDGNIGFGNSNPGSKVHISGDLQFDINPTLKWSGNTFYLQLKDNAIPNLILNATTSYDARFYIRKAGNTTNSMYIRGDGDSYINNDGNFGIGTTNPTSLLYLRGTSAVPKLSFEDAYTPLGGIQSIKVVGGVAGYLSISSDVGDALNIKRTTGNVGIGTTNPTSKLEVAGTISATSNITNVNTITGTNGSNYAGVGAFNTGAGHGLYASAPGPGFAGYFSGNVCISGNTGIGTDAPTEKLYVVGNFCATGSKNAVVPTSQGMTKVYSEESAEVWFTDYGEGHLTNGYCRIDLDPLFIETVTISEEQPIKVFIEEYGECNDLFVIRSNTFFEIFEKNNGNSNAPFGYRIVAKRKGYESDRLETIVTASTNVEGGTK